MLSKCLLTYKDKRLVVDISLYTKENGDVETQDLDFMAEVKQKACEKLGEILINPQDRTEELFLAIVLSNGKDYHQTIMNECLKYLEETLHIRLKFLRVSSHQVKISSNYQYLCQKENNEEYFSEVRVAVIGNVDAGKSTLLGVLSRGCLDDGRGSARLRVFRHPHEANTGRTSSVGTIVVGFDENGEIVRRAHISNQQKDRLNSKEICKQSKKVIIFVDLAGHEKYLKTTIFGLLGHYPDFALLIVGANMGTVGMTIEHLNISTSISIPTFIVITKIDICPHDILVETKKKISKLIKDTNRKAYLIRNEDDAVTAAINFNLKICPVFLISSVTGQDINVLKVFLNLLIRKSSLNSDKPLLYNIDDVYRVPGVGCVVGGIVKEGSINSGNSYLLGPMGKDGQFIPVIAKSLHRQRVLVTTGFAGQSIKRSELRKGMVIAAKSLNPTACFEFQAHVYIYHVAATITERYTAVVHVSTVRQTCHLKFSAKDDVLRGGDDAIVTFTFIQRPEFVQALEDHKSVTTLFGHSSDD